MLRKAPLILNLFLLILIVIIAGCDKDKSITKPEFTSLEEEIDDIAQRYVKVGAIVGIINKQQERLVFSYGTKSINNNEPPDINTVFEIGSITKTFTTTLAADMYIEGYFTDDTVGHYLPANKVTMPSRQGVEIRFVHLATHTSGIPRSPQRDPTFPLPEEYDPLNPYADYTTEHIYDYLTNYCILEFTPGTWWSYSNTGMGLLGHIMGLVDGTSYKTVLNRELFDVLGMDNSSLFLNEQQRDNLALGHNSGKEIVPNWYANDIFQGTGFIKSCLNDMFKYLEANMGLVESPLREAMDLAHQPQMHQGSMGDQGLAWYILELDDGQTVVYSAGDTNGYSAYIGFNKSALTGAIILLNCSMHDGSNLGSGASLLKAIMRY